MHEWLCVCNISTVLSLTWSNEYLHENIRAIWGVYQSMPQGILHFLHGTYFICHYHTWIISLISYHRNVISLLKWMSIRHVCKVLLKPYSLIHKYTSFGWIGKHYILFYPLLQCTQSMSLVCCGGVLRIDPTSENQLPLYSLIKIVKISHIALFQIWLV